MNRTGLVGGPFRESLGPMGRPASRAFFDWHTHDWQKEEEWIFESAFVIFREIAQKALPAAMSTF